MRRFFFLFSLLSFSALAHGMNHESANEMVGYEDPYTSQNFCATWMQGHQFVPQDFAKLQHYVYDHVIDRLKEFCNPDQNKTLCAPFLGADYGYINVGAVETGSLAPVALLNARFKELRATANVYVDGISSIYKEFMASKDKTSVNTKICHLFFSGYTNLKIGLWGAHPLWTQKRTTDTGEEYAYATNPFYTTYFLKEAFDVLVQESKQLRSKLELSKSTGKYYYPHSLSALIEGYRLPGMPSQGLSLGCQGDACSQALKRLGYSIDSQGELHREKGLCPEPQVVEKIVYVAKDGSSAEPTIIYRDREVIKEVPAKSTGATPAGSMFAYAAGQFINEVTKAPSILANLLAKIKEDPKIHVESEYFKKLKGNFLVSGMKLGEYGGFEEQELAKIIVSDTTWSERAQLYTLGWIKAVDAEKLKQLGTGLAKSGATIAGEYAVSWGAQKFGMSLACANVLAHELGAATRAAMGAGPVGFALDQAFYLYTGWDDIKNCYQSVMYTYKA